MPPINILFAFLSFGFLVSLSFFVLLKNIKNKKNQFFFIFSFAFSLWLLFSALADFSINVPKALMYAKLAMIGPPIMVAFVLLFVLNFPKKTQKLSKLTIFLILLPAIIMEFFIPTKFNIKNVKIEEWGTSYEPGILFTALLIMIIVYFSICLVILLKKHSKAKGLEKEQIKYFFLAISSSVTIAGITNIILPFLGHAKASAYGPAITTIIFNYIIASSIIKHRLLDVRIIIQETIVYLTTFAYLFILYFAQIYAYKNLTSISIESVSLIAGTVSMILTIASLKYINSIIKNLTSPLLFKNRYNFSSVWSDLNNALNSNLNLEEALNKSFSILMKAIDIEKITFLLYDEALGKFISKKSLGFSSDINLEISKTNALYKYLNKTKGPVISDELEMKLNDGALKETEKNIAKNAIKQFKKWSVYICQPIIKNKSIIGIVCVGEKISGNQFQNEDLKLIDAFSNQVMLVIENYLVFSEVKAKKEQLEKNMNLMVGRELKMMELKKKIKELEEVKA